MKRRTISFLKQHIRRISSVPGYYLPYAIYKGRARTPSCVDIELTYRCNLRCRICPQELYKNQQGKRIDDRQEMSEQDIDRIFGDLAAMKVGYITLTGGEPFVRRDIFSIIHSARKHGLFVNILSNGALLDESIAEEISRLRVGSITFSLDGDQETHDHIRGVKGSFSRLIRGIETIIQSGNGGYRPLLSLNCTISRLNQNNFGDIIAIASDLGIRSINYGFLFFTNEEAVLKTSDDIPLMGAKDENQILPTELKDVDTYKIEKEIIRSFDLAKKFDVYITFSPPLRGKNIHKYFTQIEYSYCRKCFFPWYSSRINPYGDVYPCSIDTGIGNIRSAPFSKIWNNPRYVHFRNTLKKKGLFPKCSKCCVLNTKLWDYLPRTKIY
jgi:radical SAM protein with 4Fe4S-binding SPASM domain